MPEQLNILAIGDIIGRAGRRALQLHLPQLIDKHDIDFVVANGENLAAGFGLTEDTANEMFDIGVDVLTNGNHCWDQRQIMPVMDEDERYIRPANFTINAPGRGWTIRETASGQRIAVVNLIGQVFMGTWDCPFTEAAAIMREIPDDVAAVIVDMHAEASSEKMGMGWHLDGQASFVYGTHTHVPTCDETVLPKGCAYQTDLGMTGCYQSIIGMQVEGALKRMIDRLPQRFQAVERGATIYATLVRVNAQTRRASHIERIRILPD